MLKGRKRGRGGISSSSELGESVVVMVGLMTVSMSDFLADDA